MKETLYVLSGLLIFTTLAPHLPGKHWLIRVWEFPRVQQVVAMGVVLALWAILPVSVDFFAAITIGILMAAGIYQLFWIIPYTSLWSAEVERYSGKDDEAATVSIMTSNVYMHNKNSAGLINLVNKYQPDMLVTLETNQRWEDELAELHADYPHRMACPLENLYGMHLYSRLPFEKQQLRFVVEDGVPSMQVDVLLGKQTVTMYFLHPKPPSPTENKTARPRDVELAIIGQEIAKADNPVVVAGDLNDVAWSPTTREFREISNALDPRIGRGFFNTFHAKYPLIRWPLDHVFHSKGFMLCDIKRLEGYGSDHFPLLTRLALSPRNVSSSDRKTEK
ncbi:endonuclease/exonuclease/phosphatase family protein [Alteromonas sp. ASW11-19]|uniref:Endonuclease/exonuclease/phosphatase family protein n=1 Tax=Alteromonas salexigens TaxID=2982530 RepID=A0ABT2VTV4_9ALTE|nr:endonuclease/exonuclease/phosphatase family protein [Alteromonas salexigens]MCU7555868.1 endonuclease/exonuclease/phosphatase family protein [Alteromonas salexigens]